MENEQRRDCLKCGAKLRPTKYPDLVPARYWFDEKDMAGCPEGGFHEVVQLPPEDPFERFEPNPLWTPENVSRPCKCGWYRQEDDSLMKWYCSMEHYLDD